MTWTFDEPRANVYMQPSKSPLAFHPNWVFTVSPRFLPHSPLLSASSLKMRAILVALAAAGERAHKGRRGGGVAAAAVAASTHKCCHCSVPLARSQLSVLSPCVTACLLAGAAAQSGCDCSGDGWSGGAYTGRIGCAAHLAATGDTAPFCMVGCLPAKGSKEGKLSVCSWI